MEAWTAEEIGRIVVFIAPGFVARAAYAARFPREAPEELSMIVSSIVLSLPLVALTKALAWQLGLADVSVTDLAYVAVLFTVSALAGYAAAFVRGRTQVRAVLARWGLAHQPERSIYAQTMLALPPDAAITVEFTDGRKLSGTPRIGPSGGPGDVEHIFLTNAMWWDSGSQTWVDAGASNVIVPLDHLHNITLDRDPT